MTDESEGTVIWTSTTDDDEEGWMRLRQFSDGSCQFEQKKVEVGAWSDVVTWVSLDAPSADSLCDLMTAGMFLTTDHDHCFFDSSFRRHCEVNL